MLTYSFLFAFKYAIFSVNLRSDVQIFMQKIIFCLIFLFYSMCISAQSVRVRSVTKGRVLVTKGKLRSTIDLSKNVAGCAYVPAIYKRNLDKKGCAASPATFTLADSATKNNQTFLVIEAESIGNCNVCGECGASEAYSLIWLRLDNRLRVLEQKSLPIEDCRANVSLLSEGIDFSETTQNSNLTTKFNNDIMIVETEKRIYENTDGNNYEFSHLEYNRKTPEKGFIIKTEKRAESSAKGN